MNGLLDRMMNEHWAPRSIRLFRLSVYCLVMYNTIVLTIPSITEFYYGTMPIDFPSGWGYKLVMAAHNPDPWSLAVILLLLIAQVFGVLMLFKPKLTTLSAVIVYVTTVIVYNRLYHFNIGGNYLLHIMLFFLIFMNENVQRGSFLGAERRIVSNLFFWACRTQVLMVYFLSGAYKLKGSSWLDGSAVKIITHVDEFTLPWFKAGPANWEWFTTFSTYLTLVYLIGFPILVWSKKIKNKLLLFGVIYHLGLGWVIGVVDFSIMMIICYILFMDERLLERFTPRLPIEKRTITHPG